MIQRLVISPVSVSYALTLSRRMLATVTNAAEIPYGMPTTYRHSIWQGSPPTEPRKPDEFWPPEALHFRPKLGVASKVEGRKILVCVSTNDWAGSVAALRSAFSFNLSEKDEILVYSAPKAIPETRMDVLISEGQKTAALVKMVQMIAREYHKHPPRIEVAASTHQPKIEIIKKILQEDTDVVILGNGRYPPTKTGNVATYVMQNAPCDVLVVKGGSFVEGE
jgi:nucleotide-binding universal stress UspA family protein